MSQSTIPTFDRIKAKAKITALGVSVASIARDMGYERQTVGHWLRGRGEPDMQQLHSMAKTLGCHWLELVNDDAQVVNDPEQLARHKKMQKASPAILAAIDAILATSEPKEG